VDARQDAVTALSPGFAACALELGLRDCSLRYEGGPPTSTALEARLAADVQRGATGLGPHLHDLKVAAGDRDLRSFGSQGEQRLALLALLLAEAELLPSPPLVLLDDVLSELDSRRCRVLTERVATMEQVVITATQRGALPLDPSQVVEVTPGQAV
jgi:DNA replication and repair protein RecF